MCVCVCFYCTHSAELLALVAHLLPDGPALSAKKVAQVDGVDGGAGFLVQRGLLADPVVDVPIQGAVVIQERLHHETEVRRTYSSLSPWR